MSKRFRKSFTMRLLLICTASGCLASVLCLALYLFAKSVYQRYALNMDPMHLTRMLVENTIGEVGAIALLWIVFFMLFMVLFSRRYVKILKDVSYGISEIADGNFTVSVNEKGDDDLGILSKSVNAAAKKLRAAVEGGEFAKTSKDLLIVNVAHDLKTPLTSITGYLGLIADNENLDGERIRHYARIAHNKSLRMQRLIDDLFDFTRYNYSAGTIKKVNTDIALLCNQLVDEFYPLFLEKQLTARMICRENRVLCPCDADLLARAVGNLLNNAIKYGGDGLYVDIEVGRDGQNAFICVTNYDSYIEREDMDRIFDMFYRSDESRTSGGGSGLGLAIVKNITELHGGTVTCESHLKKTSFLIALPLSQTGLKNKNLQTGV